MSPSGAPAGHPGEYHGAGEVGHERRARRGGQLAWRALLNHLARIDHTHPIAELRGLGEVVGHEQGGHFDLAQHRRQLARGAGPGASIEGRERLIEQDHLGATCERPCHGHALSLPSGQRAGAGVRQLREAETLELCQRARSLLRAGHAAQRVGHVLPGGQVGKERVLLEDVATAAVLGSNVDAALGVEPDLAVGLNAAALGTHEPGHDAQHARLARPGRAGQGEALPRRHLERNVELQRAEASLALNAQHRRALRFRPRASRTGGSHRIPPPTLPTGPGRRRTGSRSGHRWPAAPSV